MSDAPDHQDFDEFLDRVASQGTSPPSESRIGSRRYPAPGGFWIRAVAYFIDALLIVPLTVGLVFLALSTKRSLLAIVAYIPGLI